MTRAPDQVYDLIIVGAGPAGAIAALYAEKHGLTTLLLEKERFPRDKVCGDALSGKAVAILHELGLVEEIKSLPGATIRHVIFGSAEHRDAAIDLQRHGYRDNLTGTTFPGGGFVIRRQIFDYFLFKKAREKVAKCIEEFAVEELDYDDSGDQRVVRGRSRNSDVITEFRGRIVLGCDGFNSVVARQCGLYRHESRHWIVALRCYYENVQDLTNQIELHFVDAVRPGYFWIFPLEEGCANVGIGCVHETLKRKGIKLKKALASTIGSPEFRSRFANARPLEEPIGWNLPVGSKRRKIHDQNVMLLGDAASLIDPFTGEGIGNALYSARFAVETAAAALQADDCSARFLKRYEDELWSELGNELKVSTRMQQLGRVRPLLNFVIRKAAKNPAVGDLIGGMIANSVPMKALTGPRFYLNLLLR
jgi:geranylgeranyl reductase family protein